VLSDGVLTWPPATAPAPAATATASASTSRGRRHQNRRRRWWAGGSRGGGRGAYGAGRVDLNGTGPRCVWGIMYKLDGSDPTRHRIRAGVARQVSTRWDAASASAGPAGCDVGVERRGGL
jgi:hypothetical protein